MQRLMGFNATYCIHLAVVNVAAIVANGWWTGRCRVTCATLIPILLPIYMIGNLLTQRRFCVSASVMGPHTHARARTPLSCQYWAGQVHSAMHDAANLLV